MRPDRLHGKKVIDTKARALGEVDTVEMDVSSWKVTHICINLSDDAVETLGYKKPLIGKVRINIPVEIVKAVGDVITIDRGIAEVGGLVKPRS